jgi:hypothetical protein
LVADASDSERIQAAVVRYARQDWHRLTHALVLAQQDWRDVLVGTELADEDWRQVLDVELGHALLCLRERFGWSALRRAGIVVAFGACYLRLLRRGANRADLRRP